MATIINQGEESLLDLRDYHKQIITPAYRDYKNNSFMDGFYQHFKFYKANLS